MTKTLNKTSFKELYINHVFGYVLLKKFNEKKKNKINLN